MEKKMTKKDFFNAIIAKVADDAVLVEFCQKQIDALNSTSLSKRDIENKAFNKACRAKVEAVMSKDSGMTITDILSKDAYFTEKRVSNQRVSHIIKEMMAEGIADKYVEKSKSYFILK